MLVDEGAINLWEEICVQTRWGSPLLNTYASEMEKRLRPLVDQLSTADRMTVWLETDDGECMIDDDEIVGFDRVLAAVNTDQIVGHIIRAYVMTEAMNFQNARIRMMTGE